MKTAEEIMMNHIGSIHEVGGEEIIDAMKEYARQACKEQRALCDNFIEEHKEGVEKHNLLPKMKLAPEPELK